MGQKVHPIGVRLGITQGSYSCWYAKHSMYAFFLREDQYFRNYVYKNFHQCIISSIKIERRRTEVIVHVAATQVRSLVGSDGKSLENLCRKLQTKCRCFRSKYFQNRFQPKFNFEATDKPEFQVFVRQLIRFETKTQCLANFIVTELEKRTPFRRVIRIVQERAQSLRQIRGLRLQFSGRLNGAEIARTEWIQTGRVPLHTFSANLDYSYKPAHTIYGLLGVKVWFFRILYFKFDKRC